MPPTRESVAEVTAATTFVSVSPEASAAIDCRACASVTNGRMALKDQIMVHIMIE